MNKVILMGRLTRDPEVRYSQGENATAVARYTLAVDRRFNRNGDENTADFINCVAWNKTADFMAQYVKKGALLGLEGRIQTRSYDDKEYIHGFSFGVVEVEGGGAQTLKEIIHEADSAMYECKRRNKEFYRRRQEEDKA